jgi:hypothetical protein
VLKPTPARKRAIWAALAAGPGGRVELWSQRDLEPGNKVNCGLYAACQAMAAAGLVVDGGDRMKVLVTEVLRGATGVPETDANGRGVGTSLMDLKRAMVEVFPWVRFRQGFLMTDDQLLRGLRARRHFARVHVNVPDLPERQRRWFSALARGHYVTLVGARRLATEPQVHFLDCFAPRGYRGDWVAFKDVRRAMRTRGDRTEVSLWEVGDTMRTTLVMLEAWGPTPATVTLRPGRYAVVEFDEERADYVSAKDHVVTGSRSETWQVDFRARIERRPQAGVKGSVLHVVDGPLANRFLRPKQVEVTPPGPAPQAARLKAAERRGYERALAEFRPATLPDDYFQRVTEP